VHRAETETNLCAALALPELCGLQWDSLGGHEFSDFVRDRLGNLLRLLLWFPLAHDEFGRGDPRPKVAMVRLAGANTKRP